MKLLNILIAFFFAIVVLIPALQKPGKISPEIQRQLSFAAPTDHLKVILRVMEPPPLEGIHLERKSKAERHELVVRTLQMRSEESHSPILTTLLKHEKSGQAKNIKRFWIVNSIAVEATPEVIQELAAKHSNIEIIPDLPVTLFGSTSSTQGTPGWNLSRINAPALWAKGYTGQGVVVAILDTGVDATHPDLRGSYRGGGNSWFDVFGVHPAPVDIAGSMTGHGTGVMSLIIGGNHSLNSNYGPGGPVGTAPSTQWIAAKIFDDNGNSQSMSYVVSALQWAADPDGNPGTPDAPDILNGSFGIDNPYPQTCDNYWEPAILHLESLGILPIFASGNSGVPSVPAAFKDSLAIGSIDSSDSIGQNSGGGLTPCRTASGSVYPDLVAPGVAVPIALPGAGSFPNNSYYGIGTGTSFASPHVAGAAALLMSAYLPDFSIPSIAYIPVLNAIRSTAVPLGNPIPNNTYGYGRIDISAAFNSMLASGSPRPPSLMVNSAVSGFQVTFGASYVQAGSTLAYQAYRNGVLMNPQPSFSPVTSGFSFTDQTGTASGSYTYAVTALVNHIESQKTRGLLGNIHQGNGVTANRIDGFDLAYLIDLLGATSASQNWDPAADLNGDGVVDASDLAILTTHFGQVMR